MFAAAAILTVAFGVGANTAVVSVLETVLLNPLGLRHADGVMVARTQVTKLQLSIAYNHPDFMPSCGSATLRVRGFPRSFEIVKPVPGDVEEGAAYQSG
ncbi:MAG: hypothetical protein DMF98_18445 [Acidobacteria bacterium]|nr:MAG: hypothetical protein DMF98_18445 [Acidobacteriota bacterium]